MKKPLRGPKAVADQKKQNFIERLRFIDAYVDWLKKTPNKVWSRQQNRFLSGK